MVWEEKQRHEVTVLSRVDVGERSHQRRDGEVRKLEESRGVRSITSAVCLETYFILASGGRGVCVCVCVNMLAFILMCVLQVLSASAISYFLQIFTKGHKIKGQLAG